MQSLGALPVAAPCSSQSSLYWLWLLDGVQLMRHLHITRCNRQHYSSQVRGSMERDATECIRGAHIPPPPPGSRYVPHSTPQAAAQPKITTMYSTGASGSEAWPLKFVVPSIHCRDMPMCT